MTQPYDSHAKPAGAEVVSPHPLLARKLSDSIYGGV